MRIWLLALAIMSGCATIDPYARSFFGAVQALDRGFQQTGVTQAAAQGLLVQQPSYQSTQTVIVEQPQPTQRRSMVPYVPPPPVSPPYQPLSR